MAGFGCSRARHPVREPLAVPASVASIPNVVGLVPWVVARESAKVVVARAGNRTLAYLADEDEQAIVVLDVDTSALVGRTPLSTRPGDMLLTPAGTLLVTEPDAARIEELAATVDAAQPLLHTRTLTTKREPMRMALNAAGDEVFVTSGLGRTLESFQLATGSRLRSVPLGAESRGVLIDEDSVYVSYAAESRIDVLPVAGEAAMKELPLSARADAPVRHTSALVRAGEGIVVAFGVSEDIGEPLFVRRKPQPKISEITALPGFRGGRGELSTYGGGSGPALIPIAVSIAGGTARRVSVNANCRLPVHALSTATHVYVACIGEARVDRYSMTVPQTPASSPLVGLRALAVPAGPAALASVDAQRVVVWSREARELTVFAEDAVEETAAIPLDQAVAAARMGDVANVVDSIGRRRHFRENDSPQASIAVPRAERVPESLLRGRALFFATNDKRISSDDRACATCHIEGRDDNNVWSTPNGPRRPLVLAGAGRDEHFGWRGEHATFREHVRETTARLGGTGLDDDAIAALHLYVKSLDVPPEAALSAEESHGKSLFFTERAGCGDCHHEISGWTDATAHDVGTGGALKTPALAGVGGHKVFGHAGSHTQLTAFLEKSKMGNYAALDPSEQTALVAFLRTL